MGNLKFFEQMIENRMMDLHTAFLAKVCSVSGDEAKIQPLGMRKEVGEQAEAYPVIPDVRKTKQVEKLESGDIVVCVVCDRDITDALKGINTLPPGGHHTMSDCVIVGVM